MGRKGGISGIIESQCMELFQIFLLEVKVA